MLRSLFHDAQCYTSRAPTRSIPRIRDAPRVQQCAFSLSAPRTADKPLPPRVKLKDADLTIAYLKGSGPGGQKINKTNSAVQIHHNPTGLVLKSQATRSRSQNEKIAKQLLADRVEELEKGGSGQQSRTEIKAERARKKKASKMKKSRRKYRDLEGKLRESDEGEEAGEEGGIEEVGEGEEDISQQSPEQTQSR